MRQIQSSGIKTISFLSFVFFFFLLFISTSFSSQSPANFSGIWIQDTIKSDDFYKSFEVKYTITQTLQTFTVKQIFTIKGSNEIVTREYSFSLDGKLTSIEKEGGKEKNTAQWSTDRNILTTKSIITYGNEDVGFTETYSLSGNGLVLTAEKSDIIPGLPKVKQVFKKQQ